MGRLRHDVMCFPREDGGLDVLDLLFERVVKFDAREAAALETPEMEARLAQLFLVESQTIDDMRKAAWASRTRGKPAADQAVAIEAVDWDQARALPPLVAAEWRDPERLRRVAEDRAAGRRYLMLRGFVDREAAARLRAQAEALAYERMDSEIVHAERRRLAAGELEEWQSFLTAPLTRALLGGVVGASLPAEITGNVWRLGRDDHFTVHPDGRLYRGTISLGLCEGWTAADGGAIAFGEPRASGLEVRERWLPHSGDVCLFAPDRTTWHAVEPVRSERTRFSVTSWWSA